MACSEYKKLTDTISVKNENGCQSILVNHQWTFTVPDGLSFDTNCECNAKLEGAIDLRGDIKPLVLKEDFSVYGQKFEIALDAHFNLTHNYYDIIDCKYDNREGNSNFAHKIICDTDELYVDLISDFLPFIGVDVAIRIRGDKIEPYNFSMMLQSMENDEWDHFKDFLEEIAQSVELYHAGTSRKNSNTQKSTVSDPNCIIEGTVLRRYIDVDDYISLPNGITEIADNIFSGKSNIRSVTIPEGVTRIGGRSFENCLQLKDAALPKTLEYIGEYAFCDCHKLTHIDLGENITYIGSSAFSDCLALENVIIPPNITYIDNFTFKNCQNLTKIVLPDGVEGIGCSAFAYCDNLSYLYIPSSVKEICLNFMEETPFNGCDKLTLYTPSGSYAEKFANEHGISCSNAVSSYTPPSTSSSFIADLLASYTEEEEEEEDDEIDTSSNDNDFSITDDGTLSSYYGSCSDVTLPSNITTIGKNAMLLKDSIVNLTIPEGVTSIGDSAFYSCESLESVHLPSTLQIIGEDAFNSCKALKKVIIPVNVSEISPNAFKNCTSLSSVEILGPAKIRAFVFKGCDNIISLNLGNSVVEIGEGAFQDCDSISSVDVPRSVLSIGKNAFKDCADMSSLAIHGSPVIGESAFEGCYSLESVYLDEGISQISAYAFKDCSGLESIDLPQSLQKIGHEAFNCDFEIGQMYIFLPNHVAEIEKDTFSSSCCLYVNKGSQTEKTAATQGIPVNCANLYEFKLERAHMPKDYEETVFYTQGIQIPAEDCTISKTGILNGYSGTAQNIILPNGITKLAKNIFKDHKELVSVYIPEGVTIIYDNAFYSCENLAYISLPSTLKEIRSHAFYACSKLAGIIIPDGCTKIGESAFRQTSRSTELNVFLPASISEIGNTALYDCVVHAPVDSFAEKYALQKKLPVDNLYYDQESKSLDSDNSASNQPDISVPENPETSQNSEVSAPLEIEQSCISTEEESKSEGELIYQGHPEGKQQPNQDVQCEEQQRLEEEIRRKKLEDAERQEQLLKAQQRYDSIIAACAVQEKLIKENRAWFGSKAKIRKNAQAQLVVLQKQLAQEFPNGRP